MQTRIALRVWGDYACFTRPELKVERVSYDAITPSAARGILEAIYWKPQITWVIDRIHVLRPIQFTNIRRNEVGCKVAVRGGAGAAAIMKAGAGHLGIYVDDERPRHRQQRAATILRDVAYLIEAHFDLRDDDSPQGQDPPAKHFEMFKRRALKGQYFHAPYLGCREFDCHFEWHEGDPPPSPLADTPDGDRDLGFMLRDIDFADAMTPQFFHARMVGGVIDVPLLDSAEVRS